jgi:hypothetical protein
MQRTLYPANSFGTGRVYAEAKIQLGGAGAPTILSGKNWIAKATHSGGTNVVAVTLTDPYPEVVAHSVDERDDAGAGTYATIGNIANEGSIAIPPLPITFNIRTFNSGGTASNDSSLVVVIMLAFRNSVETFGQ